MISVEGFVDLHCHSAPAPFPRIGDSADIALWCAEAGMAGLVIKSHFESTVSKVHHARRAVAAYPDFRVVASIALNRGVGGINPGAVDLALQQGAKIVWLPTIDAAHHAERFGAPGTYGIGAMTLGARKQRSFPLYSVLDANGKLTPETKNVVDIVMDYDAVLATGHIAKREILAVADYALGAGLKRMIVTHPELATPKLDLPTMVELATAGCFMETCAINLFPMFHCISIDALVEAIEAVTPERYFISSDGGQPFNPRPHDCLRVLAQSLTDKGLPPETIRTLFVDNPKTLLGI
jgi:hypothetical protein